MAFSSAAIVAAVSSSSCSGGVPSAKPSRSVPRSSRSAEESRRARSFPRPPGAGALGAWSIRGRPAGRSILLLIWACQAASSSSSIWISDPDHGRRGAVWRPARGAPGDGRGRSTISWSPAGWIASTSQTTSPVSRAAPVRRGRGRRTRPRASGPRRPSWRSGRSGRADGGEDVDRERRSARIGSRVKELRARQASTSGGRSETEEIAFAVVPTGEPSGSRAVTTVTPVAKWPITSRIAGPVRRAGAPRRAGTAPGDQRGDVGVRDSVAVENKVESSPSAIWPSSRITWHRTPARVGRPRGEADRSRAPVALGQAAGTGPEREDVAGPDEVTPRCSRGRSRRRWSGRGPPTDIPVVTPLRASIETIETVAPRRGGIAAAADRLEAEFVGAPGRAAPGRSALARSSPSG